MNDDGPIARVVVRTITIVLLAMLFSPRLDAELSVNECQIVVGGHVLGIERESFLKLFRSLVQEFVTAPLARGAALELGALEERLAEIVDDFVVLAEIEAA